MKLRVVVLGAGFGGLELSSILSESIGESLDLTLIDKNDSFYFGFSKLDVMFGRETADAVRLAYGNIKIPACAFVRKQLPPLIPTAEASQPTEGLTRATCSLLPWALITMSAPRPDSWKAAMSSTLSPALSACEM